jgi:hypothetical protein
MDFSKSNIEYKPENLRDKKMYSMGGSPELDSRSLPSSHFQTATSSSITPTTTEEDLRKKRAKERKRRTLSAALSEIEDAIEKEILLIGACKGNILLYRRERRMGPIASEELQASNHMNVIKNLVNQVNILSQSIHSEGLMEHFSGRLDRLHMKVNNEIESFSQAMDFNENFNDSSTSKSDASEGHPSSRYPLRSQKQQQETESILTLESEVVSKNSMLRSFKSLQRDLHDLNDTIKKFSLMIWVRIANEYSFDPFLIIGSLETYVSLTK